MRLTPLLLLLALSLAAPPARAADQITVAAAISLKDALADVAKSYQSDTGQSVQFTFASSGQLMAQIKNGAPIDLFISAAAKQVDQLAAAKLIDPATRRVIARNDLVLIAPANAKSPPASFKDLADPRHQRIALGDPRTVPAGEYAAQVLQALKLTDAVRPRAIYASNVRQVLDYVERGEVDAGVVYATDARESGPKVRLIDRAPADAHAPIVYPAAVVAASRHPDAARKFLDYLAGDKAQKLLAARGFAAPTRDSAVRTHHSPPPGAHAR
jgi:molybdate transport system substrate-binding protein